MVQTALALMLAHVLSDFVLQTRWMVARKAQPTVMGLHIAIVALTSAIFLGGGLPLVAIVAVSHLVIDLVKTHALPDRLWSYLADQSAHLVVIVAASILAPGSFATGLWGQWPAETVTQLSQIAVILIGLGLATLAGGPAVGLLMQRFATDALPEGLQGAGRLIGLLERAIIFLMVIVDQPAGIGFLIAAKSVLRFDTASQNQKASEYVIIGTLASFAWAMTAGFGADIALEMLNTEGP